MHDKPRYTFFSIKERFLVYTVCTYSYIGDCLINLFLQDAEVLKTDNDSLNGGEYISKYVANIDGLTRRELFAIYGLTKPNEKKDTIEINRQVSYHEFTKWFIICNTLQCFFFFF